jgi:hypothetical protein
MEVLEASDPGSASHISSDEAAEARQEALANLRTHGEAAADLADVLTSEFPTDVLAVPYAVEHGTLDDRDAWFVFEAWGEEGGDLSGRRVWVFSYDDFSVIAAQSIP